LTAALSISEKHIRGAAVAEVERSIVKRFVKEEAPTLTIVASEAQMEGVAEKSDSGAPQLLDPLVRDLFI